MSLMAFLIISALVVCLVMQLLITVFNAGHGYLASELKLFPCRTYMTLGSVRLEDGKYAVVVRPASVGGARVYQMTTVPPDVFTVEIEQTEYEAVRRYKPATCQNLNIKT